jgi:hypothetical protein
MLNFLGMRVDLAGSSSQDSMTEVSSYKPSQVAGSFTQKHNEEGEALARSERGLTTAGFARPKSK